MTSWQVSRKFNLLNRKIEEIEKIVNEMRKWLETVNGKTLSVGETDEEKQNRAIKEQGGIRYGE